MKIDSSTYRWVSAFTVAAMLFGIVVPVVQHVCMAHNVEQSGGPIHHHAEDHRSGDRDPGAQSLSGQYADGPEALDHAPKHASQHDAAGAMQVASHTAPAKPCCCDDASSPCTDERPAPASGDLLTETSAPSGDLSACCAEEVQLYAVLSSGSADRLLPVSTVAVELSGLDAASSLDAEPRPLYASLSDDTSPSSVRLHVWTATFLN